MNNEFSQYINLVVSGTLYEFLRAPFWCGIGENHLLTVKRLKQQYFQVLFTDNRFLGQEHAKLKKMF